MALRGAKASKAGGDAATDDFGGGGTMRIDCVQREPLKGLRGGDRTLRCPLLCPWRSARMRERARGRG